MEKISGLYSTYSTSLVHIDRAKLELANFDQLIVGIVIVFSKLET